MMRSLLALSAAAVLAAGCGNYIPAKEPATVVAPPIGQISTNFHVAQAGDTLFSIARKYGTDVQELARLNPNIVPSDMNAGTVVFLPASVVKPHAPKPLPLALMAPPRPGGPGYIWPLRGEVLVRFGDAVPAGGGVRSHYVEIAAASGTSVAAAKAGKAYCVADAPGLGKSVVIAHDDGSVTIYGHVAELLVRDGARVEQGQAVALSGATGRASSPRLAFMLTRNGQAVDPLRYLP